MSGYALHSEALVDLAEIWEFIAVDNPGAAERAIAEIYDAFRLLARNPYLGHQRPDLSSRPFRFWIVRSYLIAYVPPRDTLPILAVVHGRRSPRVMAAMLRDRK